MNFIEVDARGLSCPQPAMMAREAIQAGQFPIEVVVDTVTSRENVRRIGCMAGCSVEVEPAGDGFKLTISR